ncbi:mitochondrial ribosomal small subunit component [Coemansia sp. RSA 1813]|nr:mitochondrial ribosomal small subunit component [Coemansia sp. RSA 1646]KAJ1768845.1 mitochondrial ribosomal small subunit component [Coemansia sp. RSA 1843]KAJ2086917.1 mitochondrial ribosomal small subunit component [Coemansia sp. RSA 986]KAJ2211618.1 mitochondrial ribosomal small subunit component [Coemansia sp. RSA 487]KAJ2565183.1 mitochondrial ribosomal small subunit component [Coemansia sp. RSA 1813]
MYKKPSAPRGIKQAYEQLLQADLRDKVPAWLSAMRSVPPSDSLTRTPSHLSTSGKLDFEGKHAASENRQSAGISSRVKIERQLPQGCVTNRHTKSFLRTRNARPLKIVFPEDELRREFYNNHPFEKFRPRIVMETDGKNNQDWSQLSKSTSHVVGESVVRYQYYLMQTKGMSKQDAYALATSEFYKVRAREEMETRIARQEAMFYGARMLERPFSTNQIKLEKSQLAKNAKIFRQRREQQRMRSVVSEKMFVTTEET